MPIVTMPNGDRVNFPDSMSREQIRAKILEKFPEADPDRGVLQKTREFGRGEAKGLVGDMLGITKFLPGDELPGLPESARQARRGARADVQQFADAPTTSNYEGAGKFVGREAPGFLLPGGGRLATWGAEKAMGAVTPLGFLAFMHSFPHIAIPMLLARPNLYSSLQGLAMRAAPYIGKVAGAATRVGERLGGAELLNTYGRDDPNAAQTPPAPSPEPTPRAPEPGPAAPRAPPAADPGRDADTDAPVANRSSKGSRLKPVFGGAAD